MTIKDAQIELTRLKVRQEQIEREVLAVLNRGCLPPEEAKKKIDELEASGVETEIVNGKKHLVEKRIYDGREVRFTVLPLWYPLYASMDDVFESLEMDIAGVKEIKRVQARNRRIRQSWGIEDADEGDGGYVAAHEKVFEKVEEYTANKTKIEELTEALDSISAPGRNPDDVQGKIDAALTMLMKGFSIKKTKGGYRALKDLPDIQCELKVKKMMEKIEYPEIEQIDEFIMTHIKTAEGKSFSGALRQARHRQKKKKGVT
jgi:hypothetical protein